ncbi:hypothetical protein [uncultured Bacteroides sp.]|uniref:hypothetical protein n=1 Tax=uncultured Bacteroides sp. TaxID=162156 RepID=UPI00280B213C|nr:hypothetical protein [uncultured Bacteroides sp.]
MGTIDLENIMNSNTLQNIQGTTDKVNDLSSSVINLNEEIQKLENSLLSMQKVFERAMSAKIDQTENLAMIIVLRSEIGNLKSELAGLTAQLAAVKSNADISSSVSPDDGKLSNLKAVREDLKLMSSGMNVAINTASLLGIEQSRLTQIQTKLQTMISITNSLQQIANVLNGAGVANTLLLSRAKQVLTAANMALATSLGISTVAAQALMATLTLGLSVVITGLVLLWDNYTTSQAEAAKANEAFRSKVADMSASTVANFHKMSGEYEALGESLEDKQKYIDENQEAFKQLGVSITSVADAENLFNSQKDAFIESIELRAKAVAAMELASEKYKASMIAMMEAESMPDKKTVFVSQGMFGPAMSYEVDNSDKSKAIEKAKAQEGEGTKYITQSLAFSNQSAETLKKADIKAADTVVKGSIEAIEASIKRKKEALSKVTSRGEYNKLMAQINAEQSKLDKITGANIRTVTPEEQTSFIEQLGQAELKARRKITAMTIAAIGDEAKKEREQEELNHQLELDRIDREENDRIQAIKEARKKGIKVDKTVEDIVKNQANEQRAIENKRTKEQQNRINENEKQGVRDLQDEINSHSASTLERRLKDIDKTYDELVKRANKDPEMIESINKNREADKDIERNRSKLDVLDNAEQIELQRQEIATQGLEMDEYVEQQRNDIMLKYAKERLAILSTMNDEQSLQEKEQLETTIAGLEKQGKKPKSIKGILDEKTMNSLVKHYQKLGSSEEEAKEKAADFATTFQGRMQTASEVVGSLKGAFGGLDEGLDMALDAVGSIADGFANGGLVGGIAAAAEQVISVTAGLIGAKKEMDAGMVARYGVWMEAMDDLIDKQIGLLDKLGGNNFGSNIRKTAEDIGKQIAASRTMLGEAGSAGSSVGSHSYGYRLNRTLKDYKSELRQIGINTTTWGEMSDDQLVKLREIPNLWAHIPSQMREYIEAMAESKEKLAEFNQEVQDTVLGFSFSDITGMIVDSFTDPSIDNALDKLSQNIDGAIGDIIKKTLARNMLTEEMNKLVSKLFQSMDKGNYNYSLDSKAASDFKKRVMELGQQYNTAWETMKESFSEAGIDLEGKEKEENSEQSGRSGSFTTMSQEQGTKLEGLFTSVQDHVSSIDTTVFDISRSMYEASDSLVAIVRNTGYCYHLEQMAADISELKRDGIKMK